MNKTERTIVFLKGRAEALGKEVSSMSSELSDLQSEIKDPKFCGLCEGLTALEFLHGNTFDPEYQSTIKRAINALTKVINIRDHKEWEKEQAKQQEAKA